jgi:hypothetical protein
MQNFHFWTEKQGLSKIHSFYFQEEKTYPDNQHQLIFDQFAQNVYQK